MTTSITDARFTHLHATNNYILALLNDEPPETGWSVMPGFDQDVLLAPYLEPPRQDSDDTLPSHVHPSYPYGRPKTAGTKPGTAVPIRAAAGSHLDESQHQDRWDELDMTGVIENADGREVPPVMAGSKRPPSPPSPALRPDRVPPPRSAHLRRHLERQRHATPPAPADPFDAPVPNETYSAAEPDEDPETMAQQQQQQQQQPNMSSEGYQQSP